MHEFAKMDRVKMDRVLAEMVGIGLAAVCGVLGAVVKSAGENLESEEETTQTT
jgi:hypothetical protein